MHEHPKLSVSRATLPEGHWLRRMPQVAGGLGLLTTALTWTLGRSDLAATTYSWLVAFLFCVSIALGALLFVLIHYATRAAWSVIVRRLAEQTAATMPLFTLLILPIVASFHDVYHWAHEGAADHDALLAGKAPFLNDTFFLTRMAIYFVIWCGLAWFYSSRSLRQDSDGERSITVRLQALAGPGLMLMALTTSFASIDWIMSLDPHWYSTMFGVYFFSGCLVGFFAFLSLMCVTLQRAGINVISTEHLQDVGKWLFVALVFWAYIGFSQYFLIWYANIPEETTFFNHRMHGSWAAMTMLLVVGHFVLPFAFLMSKWTKRNPLTLSIGATWMLVMHYVDIYWLVMPNHTPDGVHFGLGDLLALIAVVCLSFAFFAWRLTRSPVVPISDPRLPESLVFQNM